jgi:CopG family nickel-responsive transcriptional regulator
MQRVTISIDEALADSFDRFLEVRGSPSRSEGVRDLIREALRGWLGAEDERECVADLSYIYDRQTRALAQRLSEMQHAHHDIIISTHLVRLDHRNSLESIFLKGNAGKVRAFAEQIRSERGVRFGSINLVNVELSDAHDHAHDHNHDGLPHFHPEDK